MDMEEMTMHVLHVVSGLGTPDGDSHVSMYLDIPSDFVVVTKPLVHTNLARRHAKLILAPALAYVDVGRTCAERRGEGVVARPKMEAKRSV